MTSFLPSIEEKPSLAISSAHDGRGEHMPLLVAARKREFDIHVGTDPGEWWEAQVMMTEDNIVITVVRQSPDRSVRILTLETIAQFRSSRTPGDNPNVLTR